MQRKRYEFRPVTAPVSLDDQVAALNDYGSDGWFPIEIRTNNMILAREVPAYHNQGTDSEASKT